MVSLSPAFLLLLSSPPRLCFSWAVAVGIVTQALVFPALSLVCPLGLLDFLHKEEVDLDCNSAFSSCFPCSRHGMKVGIENLRTWRGD